MESFTAGLISLEDALATMLAQISPVAETETLSLIAAPGRITAAAVISPIDVPPFANSAMDGYAVRLVDLQEGKPLNIAGKAFAGAPFAGEWPAGSVIRIMTGAPVPEGCEAVVMQEETEKVGETVFIRADVVKGQNIRLAGEDIVAGASVLVPGVRLGAAETPSARLAWRGES